VLVLGWPHETTQLVCNSLPLWALSSGIRLSETRTTRSWCWMCLTISVTASLRTGRHPSSASAGTRVFRAVRPACLSCLLSVLSVLSVLCVCFGLSCLLSVCCISCPSCLVCFIVSVLSLLSLVSCLSSGLSHTVCLAVWLAVCLFVCLSVCLFVCLSVCSVLSVCLSLVLVWLSAEKVVQGLSRVYVARSQLPSYSSRNGSPFGKD
jgi:hypothetical protein